MCKKKKPETKDLKKKRKLKDIVLPDGDRLEETLQDRITDLQSYINPAQRAMLHKFGSY